jgi:hypothetical protein
LVPEVEENLEGVASERLQGINMKTHFPVKNSEFEKLLLKFNHRKKVCRTAKDLLQNGSNRIQRGAQARTTKSGNKPEARTQIRSWGTDRATKRGAYLRGESKTMGGIKRRRIHLISRTADDDGGEMTAAS